MRSLARIGLAVILAAPAAAVAQVQPYQPTRLPAWVPSAAPPGSRPDMLINPPPATFSGPWRPEYGTMIAPPWTRP